MFGSRTMLPSFSSHASTRFPRSALISFPDACMGPRQCPHAVLGSGHPVEGLTNPPPLDVVVVVVLTDFSRTYSSGFKLPQGGILLPTCFIDGRPLPMNQILGPLVLPVAHLPILQDAHNLFAELDLDHRRVSLCLHSV